MLEPDEGKLSSPVLRELASSNGAGYSAEMSDDVRKRDFWLGITFGWPVIRPKFAEDDPPFDADR
jgi:hypothetical protein